MTLSGIGNGFGVTQASVGLLNRKIVSRVGDKVRAIILVVALLNAKGFSVD